MIKNLTVAKTVKPFLLLSNCFIKCPAISHNSVFENVAVQKQNIYKMSCFLTATLLKCCFFYLVLFYH